MRMLRIIQNPLHPCPPGTHGCENPWHPIAVDLVQIPADGSPVAVPVAFGAAHVAVEIIEAPDTPGEMAARL